MTKEEIIEAARLSKICCEEENQRINTAASESLDDFVIEHRLELIEMAQWASENGYLAG